MILDTDSDGMPDAWERDNVLDPELNDALADPDGDGISNLLEFALALNPQQPSLLGLPSVFIGNAAGTLAAPGETGYLTIAVTRNPAATGLQFRVEVTGEMSTWLSDSENIAALEDTTTMLKARDKTPVSGEVKRFIRLNVSVP